MRLPISLPSLRVLKSGQLSETLVFFYISDTVNSCYAAGQQTQKIIEPQG